MTLYRILARTFINGSLREAGEVVDYDGVAGSTLQPVETNSAVKIPDDWRALNGLQRIALARALGAPKSRLSAADADQWIGNELENRATVTTAKPAAAKSEPTPSVQTEAPHDFHGPVAKVPSADNGVA